MIARLSEITEYIYQGERSDDPLSPAYLPTLFSLIRLNLSNCDLAFRFGVSKSTISRTFTKWIEILDNSLSFLITWHDAVLFRPNYGLKITSIIDCFKIFIKKLSNFLAKYEAKIKLMDCIHPFLLFDKQNTNLTESNNTLMSLRQHLSSFAVKSFEGKS